MTPKLKLKILVLAMLLLPICASSQSTANLVPLSQYLKKNSATDPIAKIYVLDRCIALFIMFTSEAKGIKDKDAESFADTARNAYTDLIFYHADLLMKTFKDPDKSSKDHLELITKKLVPSYQKKVADVADVGDSVMDDALIGGDLNICADLLRSVRKK